MYEEQHHPVLVMENQSLPEQVEEGAEVGHEPHHELNTVHRYRYHIGGSEPKHQGLLYRSTVIVEKL